MRMTWFLKRVSDNLRVVRSLKGSTLESTRNRPTHITRDRGEGYRPGPAKLSGDADGQQVRSHPRRRRDQDGPAPRPAPPRLSPVGRSAPAGRTARLLALRRVPRRHPGNLRLETLRHALLRR